MHTAFNGTLIIGISSRALFDLDESHAVYEAQGVNAYQNFQIQHENEILKPGVAFGLVKKLLALNQIEHQNKHQNEPQFNDQTNPKKPLVEVILLSRNSADTGLRVFNSIAHYQLDITRAAFSSGESPYRYVAAFGSHLFLSAHPQDVKHALAAGCAAATISAPNNSNQHANELRIAFDGDAVLFSDESERIYQKDGLAAFAANEKKEAKKPLAGGPFKGFLAALHQLQTHFPATTCPIRTALVTARSAPAHERVIRTLRAWNIRIDEALFLGGMAKGEFLDAFGADIFFDDQEGHCESARQHVTTAHVPHGVMNKNE